MRRTLLAVAVAAALTACGGSTVVHRSPARTSPDLAAFLRLPVATPTSCPPSVSGSSSGLHSPWVGHVDVSVFIADTASAATLRQLRSALAALPDVSHVYVESKAEAVAEFRRLYTCSARVPAAQIPASYRLVLRPVTRAERDHDVRRILAMPGVDSVSCDPSDPCTDLVAR